MDGIPTYFLSGKFKKHLNIKNKSGSKNCQVTKNFASLLLNIYQKSTYSDFSPYNFKKSVGKQWDIYKGYDQHDSHEFLNCLLDIMHEDLLQNNPK